MTAARSRAELLRLMMAHRAAAEALEGELKSRAADLFATEGSADTWRLPDGQVITAQTHDRYDVTDREAFTAWLKARYPHQVRTRVVETVEVINPKWVDEELLPTLVPMDRDHLEPGEATCVEEIAEGAVIPGVMWTRGGKLSSVSIRPDSSVRRQLKEVASLYVQGRASLLELGAI